MTKNKPLDTPAQVVAAAGPHAFPFVFNDGQADVAVYGMRLRDYFATHAPVSLADAVTVFGTYPDMNSDTERAAFMSVWSLLRYEYADAMLAQRSEGS